MSKEMCTDCGKTYEGTRYSFLCPNCKRKHQEAGWRRGAETRRRKREAQQRRETEGKDELR